MAANTTGTEPIWLRTERQSDARTLGWVASSRSDYLYQLNGRFAT